MTYAHLAALAIERGFRVRRQQLETDPELAVRWDKLQSSVNPPSSAGLVKALCR
jgi:hypothetical protein